jgi:hypothetical protein
LLQEREIKPLYTQPIQPIELGGERYALPDDFLKGLKFLKPFLGRKFAPSVEKCVYLTDGKLYAFTNSLFVDFEIGDCELPSLEFSAAAINTLSAFRTAPSELLIDGDAFTFEWKNDQQLYFGDSDHYSPVWYANALTDVRARTIDGQWLFKNGTGVDKETQRSIRRSQSWVKLWNDVYVATGCVYSRGQTLEQLDDFPNNATRLMRFERKAFAQMIKVATAIDFTTSPVCFRHSKGRGLLIERTLGSDVPDFEFSDD